MDHVLERIQVFYEIYLDEYMEEHLKNHYEKLSDNPVYPELKAIIDSMNPIRKFLGQNNIQLSKEVKFELERRK